MQFRIENLNAYHSSWLKNPHSDDDFNLIILKQGQMGYVCRLPIFSGMTGVMDSMKVKEDSEAF